jgi:multidrug resistance efflux pump
MVRNMTKSRIIKITIIILSSILLYHTIAREFTHITSVEGVINADLITMRSAIPGIVTFPSVIAPGTKVNRDTVLYDIINSRYGSAESVTRNSVLRNQLSNIVAERKGLEVQLIQLREDYARAGPLLAKQFVAKAYVEKIKNDLDRVASLIKIKLQHEKDTREDLAEVTAQLEILKHEVGRSPCEGVVWAVIARPHEFSESNAPLLKLIDKDTVWIDAYFSEKDAERLAPRHLVTIEVVASRQLLRGAIEFVRAGIGRINFDSPVEIPPTDLTHSLLASFMGLVDRCVC